MRTFVAIDLSNLLQQAIAHQQERLRAFLAEQNCANYLRWSPPQNIHLTLRFLGETSEAERRQLAAALATAVPTWQLFSLHFDQLGCFPNCRQPRVVWIGLDGELSVLHQIQSEIEEIVQRVGFAAESRAFSPHLTIARARKQRDRRELKKVGARLHEFLAVDSLRWDASLSAIHVEKLVHMQSELRPSGSVYTVLAKFPLGREL